MLPLRILVVDDEATIRELIAESLFDAGYLVDRAGNGLEALERMRSALPAAIILDMMMPRLDGQGFIDLARLNPDFASIPIIVVTAAYEGQVLADQLGAAACLTKPFELDDLVATVDRLVAGRAGRDLTAARA